MGFFYTSLTKKALHICCDAHGDQKDRGGFPYLLHPFHLAEQMDTEYEICVALLHDVIEDTQVTMEALKAQGLPEEVLTAVELLTHKEEIPYMDYVKNLSGNPLARKVKLADLSHNSDTARLDAVTERDLRRGEKYREAIRYLTEISEER